jgi:Kef-type K+ transport system membrane component KefB/nucleotide-binding universal stress UspA family protein
MAPRVPAPDARPTASHHVSTRGCPINDVIAPLGEHEVLLLLLQLGLLLLTARGLGEIAVRFRLPSVVGELLAGVLLGPSIFGLIAPATFRALVPADPGQFHLLDVVSLLGVIMLLIVTGMETDIVLIARKGRSAAMVSLFGILVPFGFGVVLAQLLPDTFIADPSQRLVFSLFIGTALGISAIPVIAKVLMEMNVVRRDIGQITLAAGMIDDTIGWILLSIVAGLARSGSVAASSVARSVLSVVVVVVFVFTIGRRAIAWLFRVVDNAIGGAMAKITLLMALALLFGSVTHLLGIEAVLGAFLIGIVVGQIKRFDRETRHIFETVTMGIFAPIFFAASGLRVDLRLLADATVLSVGLLVLATAILGKFVGAAVGGWLSGMQRWESLSLGAGMNARGAIEIIVATIGLSLGILTPEMYTIVLMVAIVTSLMAPPILRWTLQHIPMSAEERERMETDEQRRDAFLPNLHRVLLPTRGGLNSQLAARLLGSLLAGEEIEVTTMGVIPDGGPGAAARTRASVAAVDRFFHHVPAQDRRQVVQEARGDVARTIVAEAHRGYDLVVLGATGVSGPQPEAPLFDGVIGDVVTELPMPLMMVSQRGDQHRAPDEMPIRRILLPTTGARSGQHALEVTAAIARNTGAMVDVLHVIEGSPRGIEQATGHDIVWDLVERVGSDLVRLGVERVETDVTRHVRPGLAIIARIDRTGADLVVLSAGRRPVSQRVYFGYRAELVMRRASCPVVLVS